MEEVVSITEFVGSIHHTMVRAWNEAEKHQKIHFESLFNPDGTPISDEFKVPIPNSRGSPTDWHSIEIPLIALLSPTNLRISHFALELEVYAIGFDPTDAPMVQDFKLLFGTPERRDASFVSVKIVFDRFAPNTNMNDAKVSVRVIEPPEAGTDTTDIPRLHKRDSVNLKTIEVSWTSVPGATGYELQVLDADTRAPLKPTPDITYNEETASISRATLKYGIVYGVQVRSLSETGASNWSAIRYVSIPFWLRTRLPWM